MASIADLLGVQWKAANGAGDYSLSTHAAQQATDKGFEHDHVLAAANNPHHTYENGRYPGQMRHIRDGVVAVVDPSRKQVVTVYRDQEKTAPRADQRDADAVRYGRQYRRTVGGA